MPVWGIWLDNALYFSTGRKSRKARNLAANPECVICPEDASQAVVLEGTAHEIPASSLPRRFYSAYERKYNWKIEKGGEDPFFQVHPKVVFGFAESGRANPTRWLFTSPRQLSRISS